MLTVSNPTLDALLHKLVHPQLKVIDPSLDRIFRLLAALDNPQQHLPPVIHVAGTNGKGSTIAYLRAVLKEAGYRVHSYTSPHLVRFNERIRLKDKEIETEELIPLLERILALQAEYPATFFEATTAAAFLAFRDNPADIILLETGMGGRLDATNVIAQPAVTIITPIGLDHAEFLGDTLVKIAAEKAAIIKPGRSCVVGLQAPEALAVIQQVAAEKHAPLYYPAAEWEYPLPGLPGAHQVQNAAVALAALECLEGFTVTRQHIEKGLQHVDWPARLQPLANGYWRNLLPPGWELYLDGGHNPHAARVIAEWARKQFKPVSLVLGMLRNKDLQGYLAAWKGIAHRIEAVTIPDEEGCFSAQEIAEIAKQEGFAAKENATLEQALGSLANNRSGIALIAGSLYLAGYILRNN